MQSTQSRKLAAIAAIPLMITIFTACGTGSESKPVAQPGNSHAAKIADFDEWQLAYTKCMRAEGIDMADPGKGSNDMTSAAGGSADLFEKANKNCTTKIGVAPARPNEKKMTDQELLTEQLTMARCFRDAGFDVPDPKAGTLITLPRDVPDNVLKSCVPSVPGSISSTSGGN